MVSNIITSVVFTFKNSFKIKERSSRREFAIFYFLFFIYTNLLIFLDIYYERGWFLLLLGNLLFLFIPALFSLIMRRLHDLNTSAWWLLIVFVPFGVLLFFVLPFKKGTDGPNKYGPPPEY